LDLKKELIDKHRLIAIVVVCDDLPHPLDQWIRFLIRIDITQRNLIDQIG